MNSPGPKNVKKLPDNALEMHPCTLLNMMMPGINPVEVRKSEDGLVIMGYKIDGIMYTGKGSNLRYFVTFLWTWQDFWLKIAR